MSNQMLLAAKRIMYEISKNTDHEVYMVGGCVRDMLLGVEPKDIDIATNCPIDVLERMFTCHDIGASKDFGIVCININGMNFEIAQFRTESDYTDGRHPDKVELSSSFEEDVKRRDFTINAMGMDINDNVIDLVNGQKDLKTGRIVCVGNAEERFQEDALRILRAIRFAIKISLHSGKAMIVPGTKTAARNNIGLIANLSKERISEEMLKVASMGGQALATWLQQLQSWDGLKYIHPYLDAYTNPYLKHNVLHHPEGDVWHHILGCLEKSTSKDPITNLAILMHDLGKPVTLEVIENDRFEEGFQYAYQNHAHIGAERVEQLCNDIKLSSEVKAACVYCTKNHMVFIDALRMKKSKLLNLICHPQFERLQEVCLADDMSRLHAYTPDFHLKVQARIDKVKASIPTEQELYVRKLINGRLIIDVCNVTHGPDIGRIKKEVTDWAFDEKDGNVTLEDVLTKLKEYC